MSVPPRESKEQPPGLPLPHRRRTRLCTYRAQIPRRYASTSALPTRIHRGSRALNCQMLTAFDVTVSRSRASVHFDISRSNPSPSSRHLGVVALALIAPIFLLPASAALAIATGNAGFDLLSRFAVVPSIAVAILLVCPLIAMVLLAAARLRVKVQHDHGAWHGHVSLELAKGELAAAIVGLSLIAVFVAHLFADGYACLNGMRRAC
jgi:hypothetical protein